MVWLPLPESRLPLFAGGLAPAWESSPIRLDELTLQGVGEGLLAAPTRPAGLQTGLAALLVLMM
jgi:hypothetical protein